MANTSRIAGLSPVQYLNGAAYNGQARVYYIPSSDANAYAIGDPVDLAGSADSNGVASVVLATAGSTNPIVGAIVGIGEQEGTVVNINTPNTIIAPATKTRAYYVMVADDPNIIFQAQESGTTPLTATSTGLNINLASGTNNGYVSGWTLDADTEATGATLQMKLFGLVRKQNNAFGAYCQWLVLINLHRYKIGQVGV
jgi:hypothetical protein